MVDMKRRLALVTGFLSEIGLVSATAQDRPLVYAPLQVKSRGKRLSPVVSWCARCLIGRSANNSTSLEIAGFLFKSPIFGKTLS